MRKPVLNVSKHHGIAYKFLSEFSPETKLKRMKNFISSPLSRGKPSSIKTTKMSLPELVPIDPNNRAPFIVRQICKYLEENGLKQEGIFRLNGNPKVIDALQNKYNEVGDINLEDCNDMLSVACLLKILLLDLSEPVIPNLLCKHFIAAYKENEDDRDGNIKHLRKLVGFLPEEHFNLLKYLMEFLLKVLENRDWNKLTSKELGIIFGPIIFQHCSDKPEDSDAISGIVTMLLDCHSEILSNTLSSHTPLVKSVYGNPLLKCPRLNLSRCKTADKLGSNLESSSCKNTHLDKFDQSFLKSHGMVFDPSCNKYRPIFLSEGSDPVIAYEKFLLHKSLKRSKSHDEVSSLYGCLNSTGGCQLPLDDHVFRSSGLLEFNFIDSMMVKSDVAECHDKESSLLHRDIIKSCSLDSEDILSYDSDEIHEQRRQIERQAQFGKYTAQRTRRKSSSNRKRHSSKVSPIGSSSPSIITSPSPKSADSESSTTAFSFSGDENRTSGLKFSSLLSNIENESVVPCPRSLYLKSSDLDTSTEASTSTHFKKMDESSSDAHEHENFILKNLKNKFSWFRKKVLSLDKKPDKCHPSKSSKFIGSTPSDVKPSDDVFVGYDNVGPNSSTEHADEECVLQSLRFAKEMRDNMPFADQENKRLDASKSARVMEEKAAIKKSLLSFETMHGRPGFFNAGPSVKCMYDRYRLLKKVMRKSSSLSFSTIEGSGLTPILENEAMDFVADSSNRKVKVDPLKKKSPSKKRPKKVDEKYPATMKSEKLGDFDSFVEDLNLTDEHYSCSDPLLSEARSLKEDDQIRVYDQSHLVTGPSKFTDLQDCSFGSNIHEARRKSDPSCPTDNFSTENISEMSQFELMSLHQSVYCQKNVLKAKLDEYEETFKIKNGRKLRKSERGDMGTVYQQYKEMKAKLKLIGTLIMKMETKKIESN